MNQSKDLEHVLNTILQESIEIISTRSIGGGSISSAYAILTSNGSFFLKSNTGGLEMFEAEKDGLATLKINSVFRIPSIHGILHFNGNSYLLMDLIESIGKRADYWPELAKNLAGLHKATSTTFGYHRSNFIGSLPQSNNYYDSWGDFFIQERMMPQIKLARERHLVDSHFVTKFELAISRIVEEMPVEIPALIHGDLWSGNLMIDEKGQATIIDPAVYYGHREMDMAFTQMFGGFSDEFYHVYDEIYPLETGFTKRSGLYNLYPYLVHLNLFGRSYFGHIDQTVRQFT